MLHVHPESARVLYVNGAHVEEATRTFSCSWDQSMSPLAYICIDVKQKEGGGASPAFDK